MAIVTFRLAALLLFVATLCTAQEPPRLCLDTGITCINDCIGQSDGTHQWCGGCRYFVQCNGDTIYYQPCQSDTYYDDSVQACLAVSSTCEECVVWAGTTSVPPVTPPIGGGCASTGPNCLSDCDQVTNGVYQWCNRCDYFLQCSGGSTYYGECPAELLFDDNKKYCDYTSDTCHSDPCYEDLPTTPSPSLCTSSPCQFGGTCYQDTDGGYYCLCAPGYTGVNCSSVTNFCESDPCANEGSCLPIVGGYVCQCPPGYTGDHCQSVINNCASLPCLNGGTCNNGINSFQCICSPEWTGPRCEFLVDPCGSHPCANGATCVNNCGLPQCICPPGWSGTLCNTYIDHCVSSPCQNGGSCQNVIDGWICVCPPSFTGLFCDQIVDLCASNPCLNGATCVFDCGIYQCICPDGYTGYNCQSVTSACEPNPCLSGGTCTDLGDSYTCSCPIEWTGISCESPNYYHNFTCGDLLNWSEYPASNGFTRLCYFQATPDDTEGRNTQCRYTLEGIPLYDDHVGLQLAGGNFGCLVSQNYPDDLPATSYIACADNYQQDVTLGSYNESARLMVCLRYPYEGIPRE